MRQSTEGSLSLGAPDLINRRFTDPYLSVSQDEIDAEVERCLKTTPLAVALERAIEEQL
jgi:hypothetical protein